MVDFVDVYLFRITKFDIYYICHQLAFLTQPHTLPTSGTGLPGAALPLASYPGWGHRQVSHGSGPFRQTVFLLFRISGLY